MSEEKGALFFRVPVGTPFSRIFDHLTFGLGCDLIASEGSSREERMMLLIYGAAIWSKCEVAVVLLVTTRLPFAVHLMATSFP